MILLKGTVDITFYTSTGKRNNYKRLDSRHHAVYRCNLTWSFFDNFSKEKQSQRNSKLIANSFLEYSVNEDKRYTAICVHSYFIAGF